MTASTARMSAATGASKAVAEDWDKMESPVRKTGGLYAIAVSPWPLACGQNGPEGAAPIYNDGMNKAPATRRQVRRTAWWVAFAALAGFLLADLT